MSDDTELNEFTPQAPMGSPRPPAASGGGFFSSTLGRALLIGGGVIILLGIVGVVVFAVIGAQLFGVASQAVTNAQNGAVAPVTAPASGTTAAAASTGTVPSVPVIENRDVFTPRDPFIPVKAPKVSGSSTTGSSSSSTNDNAITLTDIVTNDGVRQAVFTFNGTSYTVGAGDVVDSSDWKVISVGSTTVRAEFGDQPFTFSIGEGITK